MELTRSVSIRDLRQHPAETCPDAHGVDTTGLRVQVEQLFDHPVNHAVKLTRARVVPGALSMVQVLRVLVSQSQALAVQCRLAVRPKSERFQTLLVG